MTDTPEQQTVTSVDNAPWVAFYDAMLAAVDPAKAKDEPPPEEPAP
jgi:hypothetical protein